jgi:hypothetical protein
MAHISLTPITIGGVLSPRYVEHAIGERYAAGVSI